MGEVVEVTEKPETAAERALRLAGYGPEDKDKLSEVIKQIAVRDGPDSAAEAAERLIHAAIYEDSHNWSPPIAVKFSFFALVVSTPRKALLEHACLYLELHYIQADESVAYCRKCLDDGSEASLKRARTELCAQIKELFDHEWNEIQMEGVPFPFYLSTFCEMFGAGMGLCAGAKAGAEIGGVWGASVPGLGDAAGSVIVGIFAGLVAANAVGRFAWKVSGAVAKMAQRGLHAVSRYRS